LNAYTFTNRTQAEKAAERLRVEGVRCRLWQGARPFYVVVEGEKAE
jgi:hypothetical protein